MKNKITSIATVAMAALLSCTAFAFVACTDSPDAGGNSDEYIVTLNYNDDSASRPRNIYVDAGDAIAEPAMPEREGYTFSFWQTAADGGEKISFPYTPKDDVTLFAHWEARQCTVTFDFNYDGAQTVTQTVGYSDTVTAPENIPERENFNFRYWRLQPDGVQRVEFPYVITSDITFYAYWLMSDVKIFTVSFDANYDGADELESLEVEEGDEVEFPSLRRSGYTLEGWATSPDGEPVKEPFVPTQSCTMYAVWKRQQYNITFNYNYNGAPDSGRFLRVQVEGGSMIEAPETEPLRDNYIFDGWYTNDVGGTEVMFPVEATRATTYYAHWKHVPVETNIFDAEFVEFNPLEQFPGYSGNATGTGVIREDSGGVLGATTQWGDGMSGNNRFVSFMYKQGATLTFVINSSEDVSGVTLKARLSSEYAEDFVISPSGEHAYQFIVNGVSVDYGEINVGKDGDKFVDYTISTDITLKKGENTIQLVTANSTPGGGVMTAMAPVIDCIKLETSGTARFTWSPIYDNLA